MNLASSRTAVAGALWLTIIAGCVGGTQLEEQAGLVPLVDHHQHLLSPTLAKVWSQPKPVTGERLIAQLDEAGIQRAIVLSVAYAHGSPGVPRGSDEYERVRAENNWTRDQVAQYPARLRAACSVNPLREYALEEIERCAKDPILRTGLKMQFANSRVNLRDAAHVDQLQRVFKAANTNGMAIIAHVWTGDDQVANPYDGRDVRTFLNEVLPSAPDVPIQIVHLGGSGPRLDSGTRDAMLVFAEASSEPRMRNVYFDIATNIVSRSTPADAEFVTQLVRKIGVTRVLYGSDGEIGGNAVARESWRAHHEKLKLTEAEFKTIATNVAPYMTK